MATNGNGTAVPARKLNSDFWKYWTGQTISNLGSSVTLFALPLLVYKLTGSAINLGITTAAEFTPYLLSGRSFALSVPFVISTHQGTKPSCERRPL